MCDLNNSHLGDLESLEAYKIVKHHTIQEMQSEGVVLEHKKSGARLFLMSNEDENKVFCIGFRTPPSDSTGVPHIMEHSVLCGSEKFPLKDPFVELVKGSLNTFLNAMTYSDKTVYPIASCNDKDFQNLMDVYMDGVLHPNIYKEEKIFRQEGWHYEIQEEQDPITYNGVVYNEMKGAYSSPEGILDRVTTETLFPDTCYGKDSGGDPACIPDLTYEAFLDFHRTYYHPSNSYIYLYGDMNMEEKLRWLDQEYLCHYDRQEVHSEIQKQRPFTETVEKEYFYSISEDDPEEDAAYLSLHTVVGDELDARHYVAFQILEYTLLDAPGAPLRQALIDAGIGKDVLGGYESGILQPYFSVVAKDANQSQKEDFVRVVKDTLRDLAEHGINRRSLLAGMNYYEFKYREADYGSAPKGLMYGLQCLDSWLYDGDPMMHLEYQATFDYLKKAVEEGYFEQLIRDYLLDNPFEALVILSPKKNLTAEEDACTAEKLAAYKASLDQEAVKKIAEQTRALKEFQDTPDSPEILAMVPLLERSDIDRKAETFRWTEKEIDGVKILHHNYFTSGIGYLKILFQTDPIPQEDLPYVGLLKTLYGMLNTEKYSYSELASEIFLNTGGMDFSIATFVNLEDPEHFTGAMAVSARVLYDKLELGCDLIREILLTTDFTDVKRLGEVVREARSRAKMKLESSGHSTAVARATSYFSAMASYNELIAGTTYYRFLEHLEKHFEEEKDHLIVKLQEISQKLLAKSNMLVNYTADEEGYSYLPNALKKLTALLPEKCKEAHVFAHEVSNRNEGLKMSSQVNYVARCGTFRNRSLPYTGALKILQVILSYDYLWINIRVKGGAYGCMSGFGRSGEGYLVSYRDPHMKETNQIFEGIVEYLRNFDPDDRDMTKYVIGTISNLDTPLTPSLKGSRGLAAYLSGVTDEMMQEERDQILNATKEDIRALADYVQAVLDTGALCVVGAEEKVEANRDMFGEVSALFRE